MSRDQSGIQFLQEFTDRRSRYVVLYLTVYRQFHTIKKPYPKWNTAGLSLSPCSLRRNGPYQVQGVSLVKRETLRLTASPKGKIKYS